MKRAKRHPQRPSPTPMSLVRAFANLIGQGMVPALLADAVFEAGESKADANIVCAFLTLKDGSVFELIVRKQPGDHHAIETIPAVSNPGVGTPSSSGL